MSISTVQDGSGRVEVITRVADRARNYAPAVPADLRGRGSMQDVFVIETGGVVRGQLSLSASIQPSPSFTGDHLMLLAQIQGIYGSTPFVLAEVPLSASRPTFRIAYGADAETFDRLVVAAAQLVNGALSSDFNAASVLQLNASGKFWE